MTEAHPAGGNSSDLEPVWVRIKATLATRTVFPAIPLMEDFVDWPAAAVGSWEPFLAVADAVGATLFYAETAYAAATDREHAGQLGRVEVAFTHDGVLHSWCVAADWWIEPDMPADADDDDDDQVTWVDPTTAAGVARLEDEFGADVLAAAIERCATLSLGSDAGSRYTLESHLTDEVTGDPLMREWANRSPYTDPQRQLKRAAIDYVIRHVLDANAQARRERVHAALASVGDLFDQLRQFPGWEQARLADEKRRRIREFVTANLGFYNADVGDRLYTMAKDAKRSGL